jgi:invasion protein IalB
MNHEANTMYRMKNLDKKILFGLAGCFAEFALKDDMLKKLRSAASVGKFSFADAGGHPVTVPISFNGFGAAFDALAKK